MRTYDDSKRPHLPRWLYWVGALFLLAAIFGSSNTSRSPVTSSVSGGTSYNSVPLEQKMASINAGHFVSANDIAVARFRFLLNNLHEATSGVTKIDGQVKPYAGEDPEHIANVLVYYQKKFREEQGSSMSLLELTEMVHENRMMLFNGGLDEYMAMLFMLSEHM